MIYFIDFYDSFSQNILSYLAQIANVKHIYFDQFDLIEITDLKTIVLGPGPGHINEYENFMKKIEPILKNHEIKKIGICLGHQLLLNYYHGLKIVKSKNIIHGQSTEISRRNFKKIFQVEEQIKLPETLEVQRYNSWVVQIKDSHKDFLLDKSGEVMGYYNPRYALTYQFHPESIGTNCPNLLFNEVIKKFMYS